ncbi:DUF4439 domain-containing protein [Saccharopolyspora gloriosae]|uniref:DUF4439 domain-containing protein n=1 Tax=Saccharopolyspora gloriosae TaxID=455344 RepID=UPI001FB6DFBE|nr:DUF4439 domain-containing protein [Saccharopolyspora gloriosae]
MTEELPEEGATALAAALRAEHAAVWTYEMVTAFVSRPQVRSAVAEATGVHEGHRDDTQRLIRATGATPPAAAPAYTLPQPVTDENSAISVLITVERECQIGWRSVLENTEPDDAGPGVRRTALTALTTAATRATRWRITAGQNPAAEAQPGKP